MKMENINMVIIQTDLPRSPYSHLPQTGLVSEIYEGTTDD
jgi:hypothetical protein